MITVSIIIPLYNVEPYITDCLRSVMRQTYSGPLECILVDDCGSDNSMEVAEKLIAEYKGSIEFKVLHHERNRGLSAARNTGLDAASGEYVYYLDSDDAISLDCIESMAKVVLNHPNVELVQGAVESIPYNSYYDLQLYKTPCYVESNDWVRFNAYKYGERLPVNATNKLLKKSFLIDNDLAFREGLLNEDELWSFFVYRRVKFYAVIGDKTYLRYYRPNSIMDTLTNQKRASNMEVILSEAMKTLDKPFYDLQVFKCLSFFIQYVRPFSVDRNKVNCLYLRLFICMVRIREIKMAFWFLIGVFRKSQRRRLFETIPQMYKKISEKYYTLYGNVNES